MSTDFTKILKFQKISNQFIRAKAKKILARNLIKVITKIQLTKYAYFNQ